MTTTSASLLDDDQDAWPMLDRAEEALVWVQPATPLPEVAQRLMETPDGVVVVATVMKDTSPNGSFRRPTKRAWVRPCGVVTSAELVRACAQGQDLSALTAADVRVDALLLAPGAALPPASEVARQQPHPYLLMTGCEGQLLGVAAITESGVRGWADRGAQRQSRPTQPHHSALIATIISRFADLRLADLDAEIRQTLRLVRETTQVDGIYLTLYPRPASALPHTWMDGSIVPALVPSVDQLPWSCRRLQRERMVSVPNVAHVSQAAQVDQAQWHQQEIGAVLSLPLVHRSEVVGAIGLVARHPVTGWPEETIQLLQVLGKMMVATRQRLEDERQLQENEERLRLALSATNQGLYDVDLTTGEVLVSPEYATMLGYDPATFHETEDHWREMVHPEDREVALATYEAYIAGAVPDYKMEFRLKTQTGDWKWVLSLGKIVAWDETGRPLRMLGTHTDIDDLKRAELALRASEIRFRTFMDNSPIAAWINDPDTHALEYASQGWYRHYALPPHTSLQDLEGRSLFELFGDAVATIYTKHNRWVADHNEVLEVMEPGPRLDGSPGEFLCFKFPLPQPHQKTLVAGVAIDVTDRNRTEQRLALQSSILASIARTAPLSDILTELVLALEEHLPESRCSVLFCAGDNRLYPGVAPNLPAAYSEALGGTAVGEAMGSCGTAALRRQPVIVGDIATDPLWADFRDLALSHGLRACWSIPIFASDGPVLGTLAVYFPQPRRPYPHEIDTLQVAANLAKVAIEQDQAICALAQLNRELEDRVAQRTKALQHSEARLKEAQQVARLGWWEVDVQTRQITWSEEIMALLGHPYGDPNTDLRHHLSEAGWDHFNAIVNQAIATGAPCTADLVITRHDGTQGCLFVKVALNAAAPEEGSRLFGIAMDVSDRWAMQTILQRSEERTRATLLALPDLIFRVNREGIYCEFMASPPSGNLVNPQWAIGKHLSEALPPGVSGPHLAQKLEAIHNALETQTVQCYEQVIPLNGGQRYEEVRVAPCGQDEVVFFIRDISDRKRTELELIRSRDLREAIFNESTDALFLVDVKTYRTLDCNQQAMVLFEATDKAQMVNLKGYTFHVNPFTEADIQQVFEELARHGIWMQEVEYRTLAGNTFWGNVAIRQIAVAGQRMNLVRVTDISKRKQAEVALQQTNRELARATRMKDEFLANMSHELRTPLNAVLGMAEGLQDEVFGPLNERQHDALRTIANSGDHLLALINDILDLAKIEAGQMTLDPTPVAVSYLCNSSLPFVQPQAQEKQITLRVEVPDHLPDVFGDERRLRQVLINLLNNAVKFTPVGGTVTLTAQSLDSSVEGDPPWLRIAVSDTGIGIAPEDLDKLFQPFVQIDSTLNRQYSGTGLGLALVQRMVDLHGGQVQVSSEVGVGSQFAIHLPVPASPYSPRSAPAVACPALGTPSPSDNPPLLLVVDDNEANLHTVASYLGAKGYRLEVAKTGREALALAQQHGPDLILMDIQMPDMDGLETARQIRADPNLAHTLIVALTALAMPQDRDDCLAMGVNDYISKPIKLKDLAATVRKLLNNQAHSL